MGICFSSSSSSSCSSCLRCSCLRPAAAGGTHTLVFESGPLDEALGHSFCYAPSSPPHFSPPHASSSELTISAAASASFKSISGASVSANTSTSRPVLQPRAAPFHDYDAASPRPNPAGFESSSSFTALPLQLSSSACAAAPSSGALDRGFFLSGPIERGALSGPLDGGSVPFSAPLEKQKKRRRSRVISGIPRIRRASLLRRSLSEKNRPWVVPVRNFARRCEGDPVTATTPVDGAVQWAHGKAGEDRVHVVVSEAHQWLFVGIYDGFNGPDAPEFLLGNLYRSVFNELEGLFWEEEQEIGEEAIVVEADDGMKVVAFQEDLNPRRPLWKFLAEDDEDDIIDFSSSDRFVFSLAKMRNGFGSWRKESRRMWFPRWKADWEDKEKVAQEVSDGGQSRRRKAGPVVDHSLVLEALARALENTELAYLEMTDTALERNPELALMGSCLLVVLMRDDDVYVMNVGDSRAIVAQYRPSVVAEKIEMEVVGNCGSGLDLDEGIVEDVGRGVEERVGNQIVAPEMELGALQLSTDHSTSIEEEVLRIKEEHPDDSKCIINGRVKGRLKVTRAFGAGFLKQPKLNDALLEMFRNEYIGTAPYISCSPSLCHHKLCPNDQFLVLSSDGLYQYLTNEEVVSHVENFMERFPDGDPAQSLIEELLFRAAKKAGMEFHELLDIPQGDRRKYHDDVTVMVISLEGRIWKSSGKYL